MNMPMEQLKARMDDLGLTFMAAGLETFLNDPAQQKKNLVELFTDLLELESIPRKERSARSRLKLSGIPHHKTLEDFDIDWIKGGITSSQISELSTLSFISRKQNVILMGPSGLGKTHLMCALGQKACRNGFTAYYITCTDLIENLTRAKENSRLRRKLTWFRKPHVLLIDEVGYDHLNQEQANLFFQIVNARYEQGSIIMTTNKSFGRWAEIMSDEAIASATLDRLLHHAHIYSLQGDSYRMKERLKAGVVDFF